MSDTKHTKGPWQVDCGMVQTEDGTPIAWMDRDTPKTIPTERDANARLIAAAPQLYALVRAHRISNPHDAYAETIDALIAQIEGR